MKILTLIILLIFTGFITNTFAQSPTLKLKVTPTPKEATVTPSDSDSLIQKLKKIEDLKEKIATKVAQIRENDKIATFGSIEKITDSIITLVFNGEKKTISYSEDTVVYSLLEGPKIEVTIKKLAPQSQITVLGYQSADNRSISAKYIYLEKRNIRLKGKITDKDKDNYTVTVSDNTGKYLVDIEIFSKLYKMYKEGNKIKWGFSKVNIGDYVYTAGFENQKEENRFSANYMLTVSQEIESTPSPTVKPKTTPKPTS